MIRPEVLNIYYVVYDHERNIAVLSPIDYSRILLTFELVMVSSIEAHTKPDLGFTRSQTAARTRPPSEPLSARM